MATMMQDEYLADAQNISRTAPVIRLKFEEHREYIVINNTLKHRKLIFKISSNNVINLKIHPNCYCQRTIAIFREPLKRFASNLRSVAIA
jgi:hypothetical protein